MLSPAPWFLKRWQCQRICRAGTTTGCDSGTLEAKTGYNYKIHPTGSGLPDQGSNSDFVSKKKLDTVTLDIQSLETDRKTCIKPWVIPISTKRKIGLLQQTKPANRTQKAAG